MVSYPNSSIMKIAILTLLFITNLYCYDNNGNTKESSRENSLSTSKSDNPTILDSIQNNFKSKIKDQISPYFLNREFDGYILVKRDEKMVISESFTSEQNVMTDITPFMIGSVTKSFTAELISTLREKGLLTEKTKLIDLITSLDTDIYKDITVYDLLTHSSGIPDYYNIDTFKEVRDKEMSLDDFYKWISQFPLDFESGKRHSYSNSGYNVLAYVIELLTNTKFNEYLKNEVLNPLQMGATGSIESGRPENLHKGFEPGDMPELLRAPQSIDVSWLIGSGSIYSTPDNLLKWCIEIKNRLKSDKNWKPFGWGIRKRGTELYLEQNGRIPGYASNIRIYPETDDIIIALSRIESDAVNHIAEDISVILAGKKIDKPEVRKLVKLSPNELLKYKGIYQISPNFFVTVSKTNRGLGIATGRGSNLHYAVLDPLGSDKFFFRIGYSEVKFKLSEKGLATGLFCDGSGPFPKVD